MNKSRKMEIPICFKRLLFIFCIISTASISIAQSDTIYVDQSSNSILQEGSSTYPYLKIKNAVSNAPNNSIISIANGNYKEQLVINKKLTIYSPGGDVLVDGSIKTPRELSAIRLQQFGLEGNLLKWEDGNPSTFPTTIKVLNPASNTWQILSGTENVPQLFIDSEEKLFFHKGADVGNYKYRIIIGDPDIYQLVTDFEVTVDENGPASPSDLRGREGEDGIIIKWNDNSTNEEGTIINVWTESQGGWTKIVEFPPFSGTGEIIDTLNWKPLPGERYAFLLQSFNGQGESAIYNANNLDTPFRYYCKCDYGTIFIPDCNPLGEDCCVWDWTRDIYDDMYTSIGTSDTIKIEIGSPWSTYRVPTQLDQYRDTPDFQPKDGWRLVKVVPGFETLQSTRSPYFVLYNKYDNRLRIFFYGKQDEITYNKNSITLHFEENESNPTTLMNIGGDRGYAADFKGQEVYNRIKVANTQFADNQWAWAEFLVAYDPNTQTQKNPILKIGVDGIEISTLEAFGQIELNTPNALTAKSKEDSGSGLEKAFDVFDKTKKAYETVSGVTDKVKSKLDEIERKQEGVSKDISDFFESWAPNELSAGEKALQSFFDSKVGDLVIDYAPYVGAAVGLLSSLFSSGESEMPILTLEGSINIKGTITTKDYAFERQLRVPGSIPVKYEGDDLKPTYDKTMGTFTLMETPILLMAMQEQKEDESGLMMRPMFRTIDNIRYKVNPNSGLKLKELYAAIIVRKGGLMPTYSNSSILCNTDFDFNAQKLLTISGMDSGTKIENADTINFDYCIYQTPFVPYDRFKNLPILTYDRTFIYDQYPLGVRILALLERTEGDIEESNLIVFSDAFSVYSNIAESSIIACIANGICQDMVMVPPGYLLSQPAQWYAIEDIDEWKKIYGHEVFGYSPRITDFEEGLLNQRIHDFFYSDEIVYKNLGSVLYPYWDKRLYYIYSKDHRAWPLISIGNLILNHSKVFYNSQQNTFFHGETIEASFVQYFGGPQFRINFIIEKNVNGSWIPYENLRWEIKKYSNLSDEQNSPLLKTIEYDPKYARLWKTSFSLDEPGFYKLKVRGMHLDTGQAEFLEREFRIVK